MCLRLMTIFRDLDGPTTFKRVRLGSLQEIMQPSKCLIHPAVVRASLPKSIGAGYEEGFFEAARRVFFIAVRNAETAKLVVLGKAPH
jgi:hypothetical protein